MLYYETKFLPGSMSDQVAKPNFCNELLICINERPFLGSSNAGKLIPAMGERIFAMDGVRLPAMLFTDGERLPASPGEDAILDSSNNILQVNVC